MEWIRKTDVLIVGLGLIGGSYAKALRRLGYHITAIDSDPEAIRYAVDHGVIDEGWDHVEESAVTAADVVIFALYPHVFVEWIAAHWHLFKPGCHITDVTGVKSAVIRLCHSTLCHALKQLVAKGNRPVAPLTLLYFVGLCVLGKKGVKLR